MYARRLKADALQFQLQATSRRKVVRQYLRLPLSWHRRHQTGTLIANANTNASTNTDVGATWSAIPPLPYAVGTVVLLLAAIVALFLTDLALALLGVLFMAAMLALNVTFSRRIAPRAADVQQLRAKLSAIAYESIDGALVVKSLCREAEETERVRASSVALRTAMTRVGRVQGSLRGGARRGLPGLATLGILAVGAWRLERGAVTVTEVLSMAFLFTVPAFPMVPISQVFAALRRSVVGWQRVGTVLRAGGAVRVRHGRARLFRGATGAVPGRRRLLVRRRPAGPAGRQLRGVRRSYGRARRTHRIGQVDDRRTCPDVRRGSGSAPPGRGDERRGPGPEVRLQRALDRVSTGRTTVAIARRLSTDQAADEVVVFDAGRVVQRGTHQQLVGEHDLVHARLHHAWLQETESWSG